MQKEKARMGYIFIIPSIVLVLVFIIYPVINTINMSFHDIRIQTLAEGKKFVGFENYIKLLSDQTFFDTLKFTLFFTVVAVILETIIGMMFALIMNKAMPGQGIIRTAVLIPWAIPTIVSGLMWQFMYSDQYGIINLILSKLRLIQDYIPWLIEKNTAIVAVIIADVWKTTPYMSLLILSGLQTVPQSLYEAASLDGANKIQRFFKITLPIIKPVVIVAVLFRVLATFRIYDLVVALTSGGPADGTQSLSLYTIKTYFNFGNLGYGATLAVVTFIISLLISFLFMDALKTKMEKV